MRLLQKLLGKRLGKPLCGFQKLAKGMDLVLATSIVVFDEKSSLTARELESPAIALSVSTSFDVAAAPANLFCTVLNPWQETAPRKLLQN